MSEPYIKSIESHIECFKGSKTEENKEFVEGVLYGLEMAKATILGAMKGKKEE